MSNSITELLPTCISTLVLKEKSDTLLEVNATCSFPATFIGFQGHFPGNPILPAVIQLAAIRCIAEQALGYSLCVQEYSRTKFKAMIEPDVEVNVDLSMVKSKTLLPGKFKIIDQDKKMVASGNFLFKKDLSAILRNP